MAERSFKEEVQKLRLSEGEIFRGEGILAVTKALLESGVAYVAGYQGAPISHLMDVLADAQDILAEYGIHFESSASEATAAATLAASVNYPLRGAASFKSTVGTNVASDALANLASGGVTGGALIIVGEDYGEGSSIMQERSHAFAMKSQIWLLDPRPNLPSIVRAVKAGFQLSEASHTPVMLQLRIRACHVHGHFVASNNQSPRYTLREAMEHPHRDTARIVLPPASFVHEQEKVLARWPSAVRFVREHGLNERFGPGGREVLTAGAATGLGGVVDARAAQAALGIGIVTQGGHYNTLMRVLLNLGLADLFGRAAVPIYVMNVTYPVLEEEIVEFCSHRRAILLVEEGQPNFLEQNISAILRARGSRCALHGKDLLPVAGEYTAAALLVGLRSFLEEQGVLLLAPQRAPQRHPSSEVPSDSPQKDPATGVAKGSSRVIPLHPQAVVHNRPPGFCTGCPERPIFTAMKLLERELGAHHVAADIGCHLFSILPPFNLGNTTMGYGLGTASAAAMNVQAGKRVISVMGDGGFWHNGLTSGIANAVFNRSNNVTLIVDNSYTSATGGQDILSSKAANPTRSTGHAIEQAVRGVGVRWVHTVTHTYNLKSMMDALRQALRSTEPGPKVVVAQSECMLNLQRRERPQLRRRLAAGERVVRERFGVDADTCTGDHSCIRLSGCPSLTIRSNPDPLRTDPVAAVVESCVGCGLCGEVSHAAALCPSFYKASIVTHPSIWDRLRERLRKTVIAWLQRRDEARSARWTIKESV
jgi:indolepyruvate ferredoxin oxidoreductase alpha subunit